MADSEQPKVITVSREALRAELLDFELRMRAYFDTKLELKADQSTMIGIVERIGKQELGEFTDAQMLKFKEIINDHWKTKEQRTWQLRSNKLTVGIGLSSSLAFILGILDLIRSMHV